MYGRVLQNPNEILALTSTPNKRSNHNKEGEVLPFLNTSPNPF
jgi:hypothetical protein